MKEKQRQGEREREIREIQKQDKRGRERKLEERKSYRNGENIKGVGVGPPKEALPGTGLYPPVTAGPKIVAEKRNPAHPGELPRVRAWKVIQRCEALDGV